jgi:putative hemolysin
MIHSILELEETPVREIMTPRVEMVAIEAEASLEDFLHLFREHRYSRVPVYRESVDHIVGIAYAQDLLDYHCQEDLKGHTVASIAHPPYFVPENMDAWSLLKELRRRKVHMAIVVDEFGGTAGLVTLEDVIEEIVGEIYDETDEPEDAPIKRLADGALSIQAQTPIDEVSEALGVELPEGEYDTLSGFLYERFGRIPGVGESVEWQGFRFVVESGEPAPDRKGAGGKAGGAWRGLRPSSRPTWSGPTPPTRAFPWWPWWRPRGRPFWGSTWKTPPFPSPSAPKGTPWPPWSWRAKGA